MENTMEQYREAGENFILPDHKSLCYSGRIDFEDRKKPVFIFPSSYVEIRFTGKRCKIILENQKLYWDNYIGYILDGRQEKVKLPDQGMICIDLSDQLSNGEHRLMVFKRMDRCHLVTFHGFLLESGSEILEPFPLPSRRIEVFGDSVSAGEVSEAVEYAGKPDPEHQGEYSNSWYSYAWMTARKLQARIHNVAQGGVALLDGTGWFGEPEYIGMEQVYDKLRYEPGPGAGVVKPWDFSRYTPHVVVVAIGQNDSHPEDFMGKDYQCEKSIQWRKHYKGFIQRLRTLYPQAAIILTTTILRHDLAWDKAIEEITGELGDEKVYHFMYSQNSIGTYGHIRSNEADQMSDELAAFITSLGEEIWKETK